MKIEGKISKIHFFKKVTVGLLLLFLMTFSFSSSAQNTKMEEQARSLINLLDYISVDYVNAVKDGEILDPEEYQEMMDFSTATLSFFDSVSSKTEIQDEKEIRENLQSLHVSIKNKEPLKNISNNAQQIKKIIISYDLVNITPTLYPSIKDGKKLYATNCASCHGTTGAGDGAAGVHLNPPPADLLDVEHMNQVSAMQVFNTVRLGVEGTAMQAYNELSDKEVWDLAFFVKSLTFKDNNLSEDSLKQIYSSLKDSITLSDIATLSDKELLDKLPNENKNNDLIAIRLHQIDQSAYSTLHLAVSSLDESLSLYKDKNYSQAWDKALFAYLNGIEPVEKQLMALDSRIVNELESNMNKVRSSIRKKKNVDEIKEAMKTAKVSIAKAEGLLGEQEYTFWFAFLVAASILLREGLEAVLIIVTILGFLRSMKAEKGIKWVHGGWITALGIGVASWFFTDWLLSFGNQNTEILEAVGSLVAVAILIYVGFWLHNKTDAKKWQHFIKSKVSGVLDTKKLFGLAVIAFVVVFREAFESILFLSSLELQVDPTHHSGIYFGAVSAILAVIVIAILLLRFSVKVPIKKVFQYSSIIIMIFAVVLAGQGIHAFQEAGYASVTSIPLNFHASALGIYPTMETYAAQVLVILLILIMTQWRKKTEHKLQWKAK